MGDHTLSLRGVCTGKSWCRSRLLAELAEVRCCQLVDVTAARDDRACVGRSKKCTRLTKPWRNPWVPCPPSVERVVYTERRAYLLTMHEIFTLSLTRARQREK